MHLELRRTCGERDGVVPPKRAFKMSRGKEVGRRRVPGRGSPFTGTENEVSGVVLLEMRVCSLLPPWKAMGV